MNLVQRIYGRELRTTPERTSVHQTTSGDPDEPDFAAWADTILDKSFDRIHARLFGKMRDAYRWGRRKGKRTGKIAGLEEALHLAVGLFEKGYSSAQIIERIQQQLEACANTRHDTDVVMNGQEM